MPRQARLVAVAQERLWSVLELVVSLAAETSVGTVADRKASALWPQEGCERAEDLLASPTSP